METVVIGPLIMKTIVQLNMVFFQLHLRMVLIIMEIYINQHARNGNQQIQLNNLQKYYNGNLLTYVVNREANKE